MDCHLTTDYFKTLVTNETKKLNELCRQWTHTMDTESDITEEGLGQIRSTIGKTNLLIDQRFRQFNGLIDDCELKRGLKETKVEDLQGFWDMVYYQVMDVHQLFQQLIQLKDNQWRELQTEDPHKYKSIPKKSSKVLPKQKTMKPMVRSKIRDQILNLKNKTSNQTVDKNESFGEKENQKIESPLKTDKAINETKSIESKIKSIEKHSETVPEVRNVLKRTPLRNAIKK